MRGWRCSVRTLAVAVSFVSPNRSGQMNRSVAVRVAKAVGPWIPALLLVMIFVPQGWAKFSDASGWAAAFRQWGYPVWFRMTIGTVELLASALLVSGRGAALGAILIVCDM